MFKYKKVVIKVGTNVITKDDGFLNEKVMVGLVSQISALKKQGVDVVLVSSGAMGAGRPLVGFKEKPNRVTERQILASVGQSRLMNAYDQLFSKHKFLSAQVLATKEDFRDRKHYLNMKNCLEGLLRGQIIPIINENDVVSVDELMFTDNDELAGLLSAMLDVDALILLSNVDGVLDCRSKKAEVIPIIDFKKSNIFSCITPQKSLFGRGGMLTKCRIAERMSKVGIETHIANGTVKNIILDILKGKPIGTKFLSSKKISGLKKWIAHSEGQEKGEVVIDDNAVKVLSSPEKAASLLPVGITKVSGEFEKGDIIRIVSSKGKNIGLGVAQYNSRTAKSYVGKKGKKPLIHYDYLFINQ